VQKCWGFFEYYSLEGSPLAIKGTKGAVDEEIIVRDDGGERTLIPGSLKIIDSGRGNSRRMRTPRGIGAHAVKIRSRRGGYTPWENKGLQRGARKGKEKEWLIRNLWRKVLF